LQKKKKTSKLTTNTPVGVSFCSHNIVILAGFPNKEPSYDS
jgi:hypothetical protein